jgi:nitrous oxidase accessory protein NosD
MAGAVSSIFLIGGLVVSCGGDATDTVQIVRVPADKPTIQDAVDSANNGDLILIAPGTYHESVNVATKALTIRGEDRNGVILDGRDRLLNGVSVTAPGVSVENLTVHSFRQNGVVFNGATEPDGTVNPDIVYGADEHALVGYRASYVTSYNNGLYGIYAFAARDGSIEHSYVSGSPDSGIYVGQCSPCNIVVSDVIAERNAIGYYGTNASGSVYVVNSIFRNNRLGLTPNSQKMERLSPQIETFLAGNLVIDNDDPATPIIARGFFGGGIAIGGGTRNVVVRNRVNGHDGFGIGLIELNPFDPENNRVEGNVLADNATDLVYLPSTSVTSTKGNCFAANTFTSSVPDRIESVMSCDSGGDQTYVPSPIALPKAPDGVDYRSIPAPPVQPTMPGDVTAIPGGPATTPTFPDLATIKVPDAP